MKKIAVMDSGNSSNFEAITKYFKHKDEDVEVVSLSDKEDAFEYFSKNKFDLVVLTDYTEIFSNETLALMGKVINIHPSILPAFAGPDAIKEAFLAGVKLSGITIHWVEEQPNKGKIITQYPVFIENSMRFDEFEKEIYTIEHKLYPIVIEKILEDKVFDFQDLMKSSCNNKGCGGHSSDGSDNSGGCKGCHQK